MYIYIVIYLYIFMRVCVTCIYVYIIYRINLNFALLIKCFPLSFNGNIDIESHGIFPLQNDKSLTLKVVMRGTSNRSLSFERASLATFRRSFNQKYPCFTWGYSEDIDSWGYHD